MPRLMDRSGYVLGIARRANGTLLLGILLLAVSGCAVPTREALLVARDLTAGEGPSRLKEQTQAPTRRALSFTGESGHYPVDLYVPAGHPAAALMLIPGAAEQGKDDPRLIAFARTLARARFLVMVPDLPSVRRLQIRPENIREVEESFRYLVSGRDFPVPARAGIGAFSYAVGPVVIAASREPLAGRVDFILGVGGYYDLVEVLTFATTGCYRVDGRWRRTEPNQYGKWVFVLSNLHRLPSAADRKALRRLAEWHLAGEPSPKPQVQLSSQAQTVYRLATNRDPRRVPELIEALPAEIREVIAALDPSGRDLSNLEADLILVHGRDDTIIPYTQSVALAGAVPEEQVELFIIKGLLHVDVSPGLIGQWRLLRAVDTLLRQRSG